MRKTHNWFVFFKADISFLTLKYPEDNFKNAYA